MKKLLFAILLMCVVTSGAQAQEFAAFGLNYSQDGVQGRFMLADEIAPSVYANSMYSVGKTEDDLGNTHFYQSLGVEVLKVFDLGKGFWGGPLGDASVEWQDLANNGAPATAYITGAFGLAGGKWFNQFIGIGVRGVYKTNMDNVHEWEIGGGLTVDLKVEWLEVITGLF